jgi:ABC-2 type transport system ATP-binding protein
MIPVILGSLQQAGTPAASVTVARPSLDDVYLRHTGRRYHDAETTAGDEAGTLAPEGAAR